LPSYLAVAHPAVWPVIAPFVGVRVPLPVTVQQNR